jgi:hypothetical protein
MNKLLTIAVPTYARPEKLLQLWREVLRPLHELYPDSLDIFIQDNSVSVNSYPATFLSEDFSSAKYILNEKNIGYHGNILALSRQLLLSTSGFGLMTMTTTMLLFQI